MPKAMSNIGFKVISAGIGVLVGLSIFPAIASGVATITGDTDNYSAGTLALAGLLDLIFMAGLIYSVWQSVT